jgi:hypothetical protein
MKYFHWKGALDLYISFVDLSTCRNIEQTPFSQYPAHRTRANGGLCFSIYYLKTIHVLNLNIHKMDSPNCRPTGGSAQGASHHAEQLLLFSRVVIPSHHLRPVLREAHQATGQNYALLLPLCCSHTRPSCPLDPILVFVSIRLFHGFHGIEKHVVTLLK